ncbi:MAG: universal stress protein, partial [Acidobacteriota bacterium]
MVEKIRVLIGFDGSPSARAMLDDLHWAGLPDQVEAEVVTVAETWFPLPASLGGVETGFARESMTGVDKAKRLAGEAHDYLKRLFPRWRLSYAAASGSPSAILLGQAENWHPDLLVVGAHGLTGVGGLLLGNVAQKISTEAHCPVRIARGQERAATDPLRLLVGIDGSPGAEAAVGAVARRHWPAGTEIRIVNALWNLPPPTIGLEQHETMALQISEWVAQENARIAEMIAQARKRFEAKGLAVSVSVREADPKRLLIEEAVNWKAETIFLGARGRGRLERMLLGSVSAAIVQRAPCSVEIVR